MKSARLFDRYIAVDWSAANSPVLGANSIWVAEAEAASGRILSRPPVNIATRSAAMSYVADRLADARKCGLRSLVGFDFPFGYPAGAAEAIAGQPGWRSLWQWLQQNIVDGDDNRSNRFAVADRANAKFPGGVGPYWGNSTKTEYRRLTRKKTRYVYATVAERRQVERIVRTAKTVWQLSGAGCVGSQSLTGIARLERLRREFQGACAVWPFETAFAANLDTTQAFAPIIFAEIYPSLFAVHGNDGEPPDSAQVRTVVGALAEADFEGRMRMMLSAPVALRETELEAAISEEGWILGTDRMYANARAPDRRVAIHQSRAEQHLAHHRR
ncbi:MAG: hypothetical protein GC152_04000 [Alphaproteobacteria bacterium]|nr:hypothetical protein [Alphaproteobacteria bacterium]